MHTSTDWRIFKVGPIHCSLCGVGRRHLWWVYWKFHFKFQDSSDNDSIGRNDNERCTMMNVDANVEDLKYCVGTSYILESWNPLIQSRYVSSLTMSSFDAYRHILKKFQCWPHSLVLTMRIRCMTFVVVELEVPWHFKRVPKNILWMETMTFDKYEMPHYERCCKDGWSQRLCGWDIKHPWVLKPYHTIKACV